MVEEIVEMGRGASLRMGGRCPHCRGRLMYDPDLRELVCTSCGQVIAFEERLISEKHAEYGHIGTPRHPRALYAPKDSGHGRKAGKALDKRRKRECD